MPRNGVYDEDEAGEMYVNVVHDLKSEVRIHEGSISILLPLESTTNDIERGLVSVSEVAGSDLGYRF